MPSSTAQQPARAGFSQTAAADRIRYEKSAFGPKKPGVGTAGTTVVARTIPPGPRFLFRNHCLYLERYMSDDTATLDYFFTVHLRAGGAYWSVTAADLLYQDFGSLAGRGERLQKRWAEFSSASANCSVKELASTCGPAAVDGRSGDAAAAEFEITAGAPAVPREEPESAGPQQPHCGPPLHRVWDWLMSCQNEDGGFGPNVRHDSHITSTHYVLLLLAEYGLLSHFKRIDGGERKRKVVRWIESLQVRRDRTRLIDTRGTGRSGKDGKGKDAAKADIWDKVTFYPGGFCGDKWGEIDLRFCYNAIACLVMLDCFDEVKAPLPSDRCDVDVPLLVEFILSTKNYDGGFGTVPGGESHAAYGFCAIAALSLLGQLSDSDKLGIDLDEMGYFLCTRQTPSGGLNGRPEKAPDVCYSWWILASLSMLGRLHWLDGRALGRWILQCQDDGVVEGEGQKKRFSVQDDCPGCEKDSNQQSAPTGDAAGNAGIVADARSSGEEESAACPRVPSDEEQQFPGGGIGDRPGNMPDPFHTFFGLAGLSLLVQEFRSRLGPHLTPGELDRLGDLETELLADQDGELRRLKPIDPVWALPRETVIREGLPVIFDRYAYADDPDRDKLVQPDACQYPPDLDFQ